MRNIYIDSTQVFLWMFVAILLGLFVSLGFAAYHDEKEWKVYKVENHCVEKGYISGSSGFGTGITSNGNIGSVNTYTPGKTRYVCDGDVEIFR